MKVARGAFSCTDSDMQGTPVLNIVKEAALQCGVRLLLLNFTQQNPGSFVDAHRDGNHGP
jgi:hypothetical protein